MMEEAIAEVIDPVESADSGGGEVENQEIDGGEVSGQETEKQGDGRTLPKNIQGTLKALKESHPELAKDIEELRKGYFGNKGHSEFFKTPSEARQAHAALQLVGGHEGIAEMQSKVAAIELVDTAFEQGDPQVLEDIASDFPDGFKKLISPALDKLQSMDAAAYGKTIQPHVFSALEQAGLGPVLDAVGQALAANDLARAKDLIGKSLTWYDGQKQLAGQVKKGDDPERQKLEQERAKFQSEKESSFRQDIGRDTSTHQRVEVEKALAPYLKTKSLSAEEKADITAGINGKVNALLKADGTYQAQVKALLASKTRDPEAIKRYIKAAVSEAASKAVQSRYGKMRPAAVAQNGAARPQQQINPASSGIVKISAKPNREDVDWSRTKDIMFITSKAVMKAGPYKGKTVQW